MKMLFSYDPLGKFGQDYWTNALDLLVRQADASDAILMGFHGDTPEVFVKARSSLLRQAAGSATSLTSFLAEDSDGCWRHLRSLRPLEIVELGNLPSGAKAAVGRADRSAGAEGGGESWAAFRLGCGDERDAIAFVALGSVEAADAKAKLARLRPLLPEFARSVTFGYAVDGLKSQSGAALYALDRVRVGVLIIDHQGFILLQNLEARHILDLRDGLYCDAQGRLQSSDTAAQHVLREYCLELAGRKAGEPGPRLACAIRRASGAQPFIIDAVPLEERQLPDDWNGAFMTLIDPAQSIQDTGGRLRTLFGLTDSEAQVCALISKGWTNATIARERNVSGETIKTQVSAILHKTGVSSRVDLARLVTVIASQVDMSPPACKQTSKKKR